MSLVANLSANVTAASTVPRASSTRSADETFIRTLDNRIARALPPGFYDFGAEDRWRHEGKALGVLPRHEQRKLVAIAKQGFGLAADRLSSRAAELLVLSNSGFIEDMIRVHASRGLEAEVLRQECRTAMWDAIERYDLSNGASFLAFSEWRLKGAISEAIREDSRLVRLKSRASEIADRALRAKRLLEGMATPAQFLHAFPKLTPEAAADFASLSQQRVAPTPQVIAEILDISLERLLDVWEWLDQRKLFVRIDAPLHVRGQHWVHVADATSAHQRQETWTLRDHSVDVEGEAMLGARSSLLAGALGRLSAYERRVVELVYSLDSEEVLQTQLVDGVYEDNLGFQYSAEQSVIADRRNRELSRQDDRQAQQAKPIITATQRELNLRYAEGELEFEPGTKESRELFELSGVPPTSATIQETLKGVYAKLEPELAPLREEFIYRGDNALEHSEAAAEAVRAELRKLAEEQGGIEVGGWGFLQLRDIDRLKPGRTTKGGIGKKGELRRIAELTGHVEESSGRLTFTPRADERPALVTPLLGALAEGKAPIDSGYRPRLEPARPRDLISAGLLEASEQLFLLYKGQEYTATLLADGKIKLADGRVFGAPSAAAEAAKGVRADPGWNSWHVERNGQHVSLFAIRSWYRDLGISASAQTKIEPGVRPSLSPLAAQPTETEEPRTPSLGL